MNTKRIAEKLLSARKKEMTKEQVEAQRKSFAFGNTYIENDAVTRQTVQEAANTLQEKKPAS